MSLFEHVPYTNFHDLNLSWILKFTNKVKGQLDRIDASVAAALAAQAGAEDAETGAVDAKDAAQAAAGQAAQSAQAAAGSEAAAKDYADNIADPVSGIVTSWLAENITQPTTPAIDASLSVAGAAADAKATGDAIEKQKLGELYGFDLPDTKKTFKVLQRGLNANVINIEDLFDYKTDTAIISDGTIIPLTGNYATPDFYKIPVDITLINNTANTIYVHRYSAPNENNHISGQTISVLAGRTAVITPITGSYIRISCTGSPAGADISCDIENLILTGIKEGFREISADLSKERTDNCISSYSSGYIDLNGTAGTGNYNFSNRIEVQPGQVLSFWQIISSEVVAMEARFVTAYDVSGSAVSAKGGVYLSAYIVPEGIYSIIISFNNAFADPMAIYGINKPASALSDGIILYKGTSAFNEKAVYDNIQKWRTNNFLPDDIKYYMDEKTIYCYCRPDNLSSSKLILFYNGDEATAGSSAAFIDFAANTFGFYSAYGVYDRNSLSAFQTTPISFSLDISHDYCVEYARHADTPFFTLKITDLNTLDSDISSTNAGGSAWGYMDVDPIDVLVDKVERYCTSKKNCSVLILGDSYTEGSTIAPDKNKRWCALLGNAVGSYAINGQGGAKSSDIESWIDNYIFSVFNPKYVIIETGANEQALTYYTRNMTNIINKIISKGAIPILCTVPVTTAKPDPSGYNSFVINSGLPYIDICKALTVDGDMTTQDTQYFLPDMVHPTIAGHQRIYEMALADVPFILRDISI